ncbi:MAG: thioesterase II family protein [Blastocatellia bacterium]
MSTNTKWLSCYKPKPKAKLRLFCFPYAGGGSSVFRTWSDNLPDWVEVCPIQLPGRENRILEKPFHQMSDLVKSVAQAIKPYLDLPFALFGHSMGAWIAFELAHHLNKNFDLLAQHLFVSGRFAPQIADNKTLHKLPDKEFREKLEMYGGTPKAVLESDELMELLAPLLKADFSICETYVYQQNSPLTCPISVFGATTDHLVEPDSLIEWKKETSNSFRVEIFNGDHFFLRNYQKELLTSITKDLEILTL